MGVAGQIFAARVAIGLAIPSPRALSETGGVLSKGITAIYGRLDKKRIEAQKKRVADANAEVASSKKALETASSSFGGNIVKNSRAAVKRLIQSGGDLHAEFKKRGESAFQKLSMNLGKSDAAALKAGIGKGMSSMDKMLKMTENFSKMTKAQQNEITKTSQITVKAKTRELKATKKYVKEKGKEYQLAFEGGKMTEEVYLASVKSLKRRMNTAEKNIRIAKEEHEVIQLMTNTVKVHTTKEMEKLAKAEERLGRAQEKAKTAGQKLKDMFAQTALKAKELAKNIARNVNGALQGYSDVLRNTISILTAFYYKLNQSTQALIEFERELLNANSVFNVTRDELFATGEVITQFGQKFGMEMQNGATGLYQLASAGLDADQALTVLPETLKLSMAVQGDHNTISKLTTQTLAGFGMEMDQAAEVTDKFAYAIQKSLIEYEDLSSAVKFALPFFTATGQSIDQLLGALQILTNRALEAGIAGRGLRQALAEFAENADNNEAAFRKMGINIKTASGEMKQLTEIAAEFAAVVGEDTVSNTELLTTLIDDLNVRGATAFIHLVQSSDEFTEAVENTANAGGQLDEMVRIQNESISAQIQILKNNVLAMFFMRDASYEGTEFMNGFHEAIMTTVRSLSDLLVVESDAGYELTDLGEKIRDIAINGVGQMNELLVSLVGTVKDFTSAGILNTDMLKLYLLPMKILLGVAKMLGPDITKLAVSLYILNSALGISRLSMLLFNDTTKTMFVSLWKSVSATWALAFAQKASVKTLKANWLWEKLYTAAKKKGIFWTQAKTLATYGLRAALIAASFGLLLIVAAVISFAMWMKNSADQTFIFREVLANTAELLKTIAVGILAIATLGMSNKLMGVGWFKFGMFLNNTVLMLTDLPNAIKMLFDSALGGIVDFYHKHELIFDLLMGLVVALSPAGPIVAGAILLAKYWEKIAEYMGIAAEKAPLSKERREKAKETSYWKGEEGWIPDEIAASGRMTKGYAAGGMTMVGERGPELVRLPGAAQVLNNTHTNSLLSKAFESNPLLARMFGTQTPSFANAKFENATLALNTFKGGMQT